MTSLIKEKFEFDKFERRKQAFFRLYGWRFMPFAQKDPLPDPRLLVPHQIEEIRKMINAIKEGDLVSLVVSDIGLGKTALCKFLADALPQEDHPKIATVFLAGPSIGTPEQMLRLILMRLELEPKEGDVAAQFERLYRWHEMYPDLLLVIIVDEFPEVNENALSVVRALADLHGVAWVLNGQKNLLFKLLEKYSPALLQRKRVVLELRPMNMKETEELLMLRMAWARGDFNNLTLSPFTRQAVEEIQRLSKGIPREALKIAGDAVYAAIERGSVEILPQFIRAPKRSRRIHKRTKRRRGILSFLGLRR
jgi:type II secretory pathway predicted ATPase ExeA